MDPFTNAAEAIPDYKFNDSVVLAYAFELIFFVGCIVWMIGNRSSFIRENSIASTSCSQ